MKLHSIELRDVRGIEHLVVDELPDTGVIVIAGDNEMGKSTIAEAIHVALTWPTSADRKETRALQPNNRDAFPDITLDLTLGGTRFTLRKVFAGGRKASSTEITVTEPSFMQLTGAKAQAWLDDLTRGEGTRDLWNAFVARQGTEQKALRMGAYAQVTAALQEASGGTAETEDQKSIVEAALTERALYYTSQGREKAPLKDAAAAVEAAEVRWAEASARVEEVRDLVDEAKKNDRRRVELESLVPDAEAEVEQWRRTVADLAEYRHAKSKADDAVTLATVELKNARQAAEQRAELKAQEKQAQEALDAVVAELGPLREASEAEAREVESVETTVVTARSRRERARRLLQLAETDLVHCANVRKLAELDEVLARVRSLDEEVTALRRKLAEQRITAEAAKRAAEAETEWRTATTVLEASSSELSLVADRADSDTDSDADAGTVTRKITVVVDGEDVDVVGGEAVTRAVTAPTAVTVGGVTMTVTPGDGAGEYAGRASLAKEKLDDILSELGVSTVKRAEEKAKARTLVESELDIARARLEAELSNRDLAEMRDARVELDADLVAYPGVRADMIAGWSDEFDAPDLPVGDDGEGADEAEATRVLDRAREAERAAGGDYDAAMQSVQSMNARPARHALLDKQAEEQARIGDVRRAVQALSDARERENDEALAERVAEAEKTFDTAVSVAKSAEKALVERGAEDADESLAGAETYLANLRNDQIQLQVRRGALTGELKGVSGVNEELAEAEADLTRLRRELESINRRAAAAKLLYDTLEAARAETRSTIGKPLLKKLAQYGGAVFGPSTTFELDEDMAVKSRSNADGTFEFEALSGGAQEQIDVLVRLAVAGVMDGEGGAPVIIDDALGYSDPDRLRKMNNAFARAGRDSQILVLTCYPDRFARIQDSLRLDMGELLRDGA
ncbi:AAA family ATPase [uncultured Corynebacterium sp.]|uniref:AAA family ATPase n=1 Tax=uncultured Corynebacterium sp. TaxID=159447 RepID=UPI0025CDEFBE|nr:AAA family ATPase [uncultured Corynebacterium sp.]